MKTAVRVGAVLAVVVLALLAGVTTWLNRSIPPLRGQESAAGLGAPVEVLWDSLGVPHITAASDSDALEALGYLHARDRLWEMETLRRAAEGRLAEILGPAAVDADRYLRSLDIPYAALRCERAMAPQTRGLAIAYVRGINRWIAAHSRPLGPEFQLLRFTPEPWTVNQLFEVGRLMAWDLVNAGGELELARAEVKLGPERVKELFPSYPESGAVILPKGSGHWKNGGTGARAHGRAAAAASVPSALLAAKNIPAIPPLAAELLDAASISRASNSWVIGPARTRSGKPILAYDPHLALRAPSLWYLAVVESPGFHVAGATIPGLPAIVAGHNRRIAWGLTNVGVDDVDYVIEQLSEDFSKVLTPTGWEDLTVVRDSIRVRGKPAVPFTLRRGPHGPLIGPAPGSDPLAALAMRWNALDPSDELTVLLGVDRAGNWTEFRAALSGAKAPEQNWIYADVDGNIGYQMTGAVPVRRSGNGLLPTPGWTDEGKWERYLDFEELPWALNPPEGFIVTANNRVIGPEYPYLITANWGFPYRAERIRELILGDGGGGKFTVDDVRRMQMDTVDAFARWAKEIAAKAAGDVGRPDVASKMHEWSGVMGADRTEPSIFWAWYRALQRLTFEDELPSGYAPSSPFHRWLRTGTSPWFDDVHTPQKEDLPQLAARAMREALPIAEGKRWGTQHQTLSAHMLGGQRLLDFVLGLNIGPTPRAGSLYTVDVADFTARRPPYLNTHAASFRQVVDLADIEHGAMIITTGESGNSLSRRYRDQVGRWMHGELWTVPLEKADVRAIGTLTLMPQN
ncbi:MAG: penicillin acylase family protein [Gemmatimonadales bacterium]|jgi:penicillin amidase